MARRSPRRPPSPASSPAKTSSARVSDHLQVHHALVGGRAIWIGDRLGRRPRSRAALDRRRAPRVWASSWRLPGAYRGFCRALPVLFVRLLQGSLRAATRAPVFSSSGRRRSKTRPSRPLRSPRREALRGRAPPLKASPSPLTERETSFTERVKGGRERPQTRVDPRARKQGRLAASTLTRDAPEGGEAGAGRSQGTALREGEVAGR